MPESMTFWDVTAFDFQDVLNAEIWAHSPELQIEIQPASELKDVGAEGAQQAMLDGPSAVAEGRVLPWVPDLVGKSWQTPESLLVVGSAYAGFITEYSGRRGSLALADYVRAAKEPPSEFQRLFVRDVVVLDTSYYSLLQTLIGGQFASPAHMSLFDLCRASFVQRGKRPPMDKGGDGVANKSASYLRYVEHPIEQEWLWRRITGGQARRVVALGTIAEHGLLRLFARRGMEVRATDASNVWTPNAGWDKTWPLHYADDKRKLTHWRESRNWWTIKGQIDATSIREWALLPVSHPGRPVSRTRIRQEYEVVRPILQAMLGSELQ